PCSPLHTQAPPPSCTATLSLHDALPIYEFGDDRGGVDLLHPHGVAAEVEIGDLVQERLGILVAGPQPLEVEHPDPAELAERDRRDRKSTRLNSSHVSISYAVFCLKKKNS